MSRRTWARSPHTRRKQLLDAAIALFTERGSDVTIAEITRAAGVSKGTFYVYFASKSDLIAQLRDTMIAEYHARMTNLVPGDTTFDFNSDFVRDTIAVGIDFRSSELHSILFPSAADEAYGQREVVPAYEAFLVDANRKGITNVSDPYWFAVLLVGAGNFAVWYSNEEGTFDRDTLVAAVVELQRRALEL